ncbi:MAG: hypothetical protein O3B01_08885 [Planctomycetota bacterium]|nr:hypothetical protein [Planctomycetota bacterium]MDA1138685.1 hypothetical protein [Planctomycetota bacterium]
MKLPAGWTLPQKIQDRLGDKPGRQRAMIADGHLLIILHKLPGAEDAERTGVLFWRNPEGEWRASEGKGGLVVLKKHLSDYDEAAETLEQKYESASSARVYFEILQLAIPLHRAAKNMLAALQTAREGLPDVKEIISLRDEASEITLTCELVEEDSRVGLDYDMARKADAQARISRIQAVASHRLNLLAALFLPITALASVLGMNLRHGLEDSASWAFWMILTIGLLIGLFIVLLLTKGNDEDEGASH